MMEMLIKMDNLPLMEQENRDEIIENYEYVMKVYKIALNQSIPGLTCAICCDELHYSNSILLNCGHVFHEKCAVVALDKSHDENCPMCRIRTRIIDYLDSVLDDP